MSDDTPLSGVRVVSLAVNLPGPAAAARLVALGASVTKIEPPHGDPLAHAAPDYYRELAAGQQIITADLKQMGERDALWERLADADLLLTSSRPSALHSLGFDRASVTARQPRLSTVAIVGHPGEQAELPGHDLTYQAVNGTLSPPELPRVLLADLVGAERAATEAVAALVHASRTGRGAHREVALSAAAADLAAPLRHGMTGPGGLLGGALPRYGLYRAIDGYVALAALEQHFWTRFADHAGVSEDATQIADLMRTRTAQEWQGWAAERDIPLVAVRD